MSQTSKFLGSFIPSCQDEKASRISLPLWAFSTLRQNVQCKHISRHHEECLHLELILFIATYGTEAWMLLKEDEAWFIVLEMKCL